MNLRTRSIASFFMCGLLFSACKKDEPKKDPIAENQGMFKWIYNGSETVADSAICYEDFTTIYAYKNGLLNTLEINLSAIAVGEYPVNSVMGNEIKYTIFSDTHIATSGTVTIKNVALNSLSGTFNCTLTASNQISGTFDKIRIR